MTSIWISLIGIFLFSAATLSAFIYFDAGEAEAIAKGPSAASHLSNVVIAAASFREARGTYPSSIVELRSEFDLADPDGLQASYVIDTQTACLALPDTVPNGDMLDSAKNRIPGSVVTDTCGSVSEAGKLYLAVPLG